MNNSTQPEYIKYSTVTLKPKSWRSWLLRGLIAIAAGLMIASFILPWWTAQINLITIKDPIRIYGYGLQHDLLDYREYIIADETPPYQTVIAWVYVAVSIGLAFLSTWLKGRKGQLLLGLVGGGYITYVLVAAFMVISNRLGALDIPMQGMFSTLGPGETIITVTTSLRFGYYLAYAAGGLFLLLALLSSLIAGKRLPSK